jgi:hypothetical protein
VSIFAVAACGKDVTAPSVKAIPTKIVAVSPVFLQGRVGSSVSDRPSVVVLDQNGNPMSGVAVQFTGKQEIGTLSGTNVVTDASGRATLGEWILSTTSGTNLVIASAGIPAVTFSAAGTAGPPATLFKQDGDDQFAFPKSTLLTPPSVLVRDAYGNPVAGAQVSFEVTGGGGSIQTSSVTSDGGGVARLFGWTLGGSGVQTLTAAVEGLPPVKFTATVFESPCGSVPLVVGASSPLADLESFGCALSDGRRANFYAITVATAGLYEFKSQSTTLNGVVTLALPNGTPVADASTPAASTSRFRAYLKEGQYVLRVASLSSAQFGTYQIGFTETKSIETGCEDVFLAFDTKVSQVLQKGDCEPQKSVYADSYRVFVEAGGQVEVTMASNEVDNAILVSDPTGGYITSTSSSSNETGEYAARVKFTASKSGYYFVLATTEYFSGNYTLIVQRPKP